MTIARTINLVYDMRCVISNNFCVFFVFFRKFTGTVRLYFCASVIGRFSYDLLAFLCFHRFFGLWEYMPDAMKCFHIFYKKTNSILSNFTTCILFF